MRKSNVLVLLLVLSTGCAALKEAFIQATEELHPEWTITNSPPTQVTNVPPVGANVPSNNVPAQTGPRVEKVWKKGSLLGIKVAGIESWPTRTEKGKTIVGIVCCNGKKFDWLSMGNVKDQEKVIHNLYGEEYFQPIRTGDKVFISIKNIHGKNETEFAPLIWEWESTY